MDASVMGLLKVVHRWRRPFWLTVLGLPLATAIAVLFVPNTYTAQGTILLEMNEAQVGNELLGQISTLTGLPSQVPAGEVYLAILRSRTVAEAVAESLGLARHYGAEAPEPGRALEMTLFEMWNNVEIEHPDPATLRIRATDRSPEMAASIVNAFLDELVETNETLALSRARRTRRLVERALETTRQELDGLRAEIRDFQETHGVFALDEQTRAAVELIAGLQTRLLELETQRAALAGYRKEDAPQIRSLELQIAALRQRIEDVVGNLGEDDSASAGPARPAAGSDFVLPLARIPELGDRFAHLLVDQKVLESKYNVLATHLEQTKIEESQSLPSFEVLDRAVRPYRKSGPNRRLYVLGALLAGLLAGVLLAVLLEDASRRLDSSTRTELLALVPSLLRRRKRRDPKELTSRLAGKHG